MISSSRICMRVLIASLLCVAPLSLVAAVRGALLCEGGLAVPVRIAAVYLCVDYVINEPMGGPSTFFSGISGLLIPLLFTLSAFFPYQLREVVSLVGLRVAGRSLIGPVAPARLVHAVTGLLILRPEMPSNISTALAGLAGMVALNEGVTLQMGGRLVCCFAPLMALDKFSGPKEMQQVPENFQDFESENEDDLFRGIEDLRSFED